MITTCTGCQVRFRLDDEKVPHRLIRVRCPQGQTVFALDGSQAAAQVAPLDDELVLDRTGQDFQFSESQQTASPPAQEPVTPETATTPRQQTAASSTVDEIASTGTAVAVEDGSKPRKRRTKDKSHMLARALVSDILVYNKEVRDQALQDGNLLQALGPEIKKSWELYKDKVTPEVANNTTHFRDALNEILAEGQKLF